MSDSLPQPPPEPAPEPPPAPEPEPQVVSAVIQSPRPVGKYQISSDPCDIAWAVLIKYVT